MEPDYDNMSMTYYVEPFIAVFRTFYGILQIQVVNTFNNVEKTVLVSADIDVGYNFIVKLIEGATV